MPFEIDTAIEAMLHNFDVEINITGGSETSYLVRCVCGDKVVSWGANASLELAMKKAFTDFIDLQGEPKEELDRYKRKIGLI